MGGDDPDTSSLYDTSNDIDINELELGEISSDSHSCDASDLNVPSNDPGPIPGASSDSGDASDMVVWALFCNSIQQINFQF